ncbi:glycosyltransferase family 2 protein [Peristeroidobacter soli]|uniref:glycosyltransferase family 2 protein n=1 Tax=Peristeroidobacter soli TaxID=2497877 RepID=UPI00101CDAAC|nr:glycosyltransferase family 2 protein [Peristeroidobacter soli]
MIDVDVLVLTYKRPALLADTLDSLARQQLPPGYGMNIIVIDNDAAQSARATVSRFQAEFGAVRYVCETEANIAKARNRALAEARSRYAAFIDDDEVASPQWLATLLRAREQYRASVVVGPVMPLLPVDTPRWVIAGRFFDRPRRVTGTIANPGAGGTGNVLLDLHEVSRTRVLFDASYGIWGGEDTDFFQRLAAAGVNAVWCDEAEAHEYVQPHRLKIRWLMRRSFIGGHCFARIFDKEQNSWWHATRALKYAGISASFLLLVPVSAFGGMTGIARTLCRSSRHWGRSVGLWGLFAGSASGKQQRRVAHAG